MVNTNRLVKKVMMLMTKAKLLWVIIRIGPVDFHGAALGQVFNHDDHTLSVTLDQVAEKLGMDFKNLVLHQAVSTYIL